MTFQELFEQAKEQQAKKKAVDAEKNKAFFEKIREAMKQYMDKH